MDDVVNACITAANLDSEWDVFNVGTGVKTSFNQVVEKLQEHFENKLTPIYVNNPIKNYVQHTLADINKMESVLGVKPKVTFEEGIRRIIDYYKHKQTL